MPNCADDYDSEIVDGRNCNSVKCKFCNSKILSPFAAEFISLQFELPLIAQKTGQENPETETVALFWLVNDMYTFENVGFSNTVDNTKYLTCADCEAGPIGYYDMVTKKSYVALSRVLHV